MVIMNNHGSKNGLSWCMVEFNTVAIATAAIPKLDKSRLNGIVVDVRYKGAKAKAVEGRVGSQWNGSSAYGWWDGDLRDKEVRSL